MAVYYSNPVYFSAPAPSYIPVPRFADTTYSPTPTGTSTHYLNHRSTAGPQLLNHQSTTDPHHSQVVTLARVPETIYSTPRPRPRVPAQTQTNTHTYTPSPRRSLLTHPPNHPTQTQNQNQNQNHAPYTNHTHVLYSTATRGPSYGTGTQYIPSLSSPNLGPPVPPVLSLPREIGWEPRRTLRIAFSLRKKEPARMQGQGQGKGELEGVPLGLFLRMGHRALKKVVEGAYERVLPHIYVYPCPSRATKGVTLRFWSPVHPYGVEEYVVPADAEGHYARRLTLALHVARAYYVAAFSGAKENKKNVNKDARLCRTKTTATATMSLDDLWLVSLRGTEREDVFDVCVHYHGPQSPSSSSYVW